MLAGPYINLGFMANWPEGSLASIKDTLKLIITMSQLEINFTEKWQVCKVCCIIMEHDSLFINIIFISSPCCQHYILHNVKLQVLLTIVKNMNVPKL